MIKQLSHDYYLEHLDPVLSVILNRQDGELDWRRPFSAKLPQRAILFPVSFIVPESVFIQLGREPESDEIVLSWLTRFTEPRPVQMDWSLSRNDYNDYIKVANDPVDQVLYSPQGDWAIVLNDEYGVAGSATPAVLRGIQQGAGVLADPRGFVEQVRLAGAREGFAISDSWTTELLEHVLGPTKAGSLITDAS